MVFVVVHYYGVRERGVGYLKHFVEGVPLQFPYVLLAPLVCAVHLVGEMVRPVTLALRLFGNLMAGHMVLMILIGLWLVSPQPTGFQCPSSCRTWGWRYSFQLCRR